jgi:hypothetical protein
MQESSTYRILHCGQSFENYNLCIEKQIVGFMQRGASPGDIVHLALKIEKISYCWARGILGNITDESPWEDNDLYVHRLRLNNITFCKPIDLRILAKIGGKHWSLKYLQGAKPINDIEVQKLLDSEFKQNQVDCYLNPQSYFDLTPDNPSKNSTTGDRPDEKTTDLPPIDDVDDELDNDPEQNKPIDISGTFETVHFKNETDPYQGLETLVNQYFYSLFPSYPESRTLLIAENRMFLSSGADVLNPDYNTTGIRGIPDALLIVYDQDASFPLQINLIEYECYGKGKPRALQKSQHLNGHIIPQLMKFASSFSVVTDQQIRSQTAKRWINKIIDYVFQFPEIESKVTRWLKELYSDISERQIALKLYEALETAFCNNVQIILIIDELSSEQKSTIGNVVEAFKLENQNSVKFKGYVVRLEQKISLLDQLAEFAISVESP